MKMVDLLIHNCDILAVSQNTANIAVHQDIEITGNKITGVRPSTPVLQPEVGMVVEAKGMLAIPGLINTHAHVPMVLFRGMAEDVSVQAWFNDFIWPMESNLTPEDVYWGALLGMAEMIRAGVTSVADHYFDMDQIAQAASDSGMRANLAWTIFGNEGQAKIDETSQFILRWQGKADGRITAWMGPHSNYTTSPEFLKLCAQRARDLGVGSHIHVAETAEQVKLSLETYGMTPVKELEETGILDQPAILAHCAFPTDDDLQIMGRHPCGVAHAPKTYLKLGSGIPALRRYRDAGVPVGLATDGAASNNTLDILEVMRLVALTQKDKAADSTCMTISETLQIAFEGGARVFQHADDLGALAPGKLADIALVRQDGAQVFPRFNPAANLVYSSNAADVDTTICNGKILMRDRKLLTIDMDEVKKQITERLERLSQRVPSKRIAFYQA
jgi:5-methylthioadenosine/S-adenosylhomocysteine deaminase